MLNILRYPDARLHKLAAPVTVFDEGLKKLVADMAETMYAAPGIGLAVAVARFDPTQILPWSYVGAFLALSGNWICAVRNFPASIIAPPTSIDCPLPVVYTARPRTTSRYRPSRMIAEPPRLSPR